MQWFYGLLRMNRMLPSHRIKLAGLAALKLVGYRHLCVRLDPTMKCNLRCLMCQATPRDHERKYKLEYSWDEIQRIAGIFLPHTLQLYIGCRREPTMYKQFCEIVRVAKRTYGVPMVGLVTNGQLLTRAHLDALAEYGLDELTLSTHGLTRETYERFMPPAKLDRHLELLGTILSMRGLSRRLFRVRINYVVNPDTLHELPHVLDVYSRYGISVLQIRPMKVWPVMEYDKASLADGQLLAYRRCVQRLRRQARSLGIILLANRSGAYATKAGDAAVFAEEAVHYVSPGENQKVRWPDETYADYCRRTHWYRRIISLCLSSRRTLSTKVRQIPGLLDYDIS